MTKITLPRVKYIYIFFISLFILIGLRVIYLQAFRRTFFKKLAENQYYRLIPQEAKRGKIFDACGRILATSINSYSVFADPFLIEDVKPAVEVLSGQLAIPKKDLEAKLQKKKRFVWIKRKISWEEKEKLRAFKLKGIGFIREGKRYYPQENLAASVLGIVDIDNKGLEGLELYYDRYLRGKRGWVRTLQDSTLEEVFIDPQIVSPQEGADLHLSLDIQLQYRVEKYLFETISQFLAKEGSVVVMRADTGEILALASYPSFNPNFVSRYPLEARKNRAICDIFEPGSVFKIVTLLAALEEKKFSEEDKIFCENGAFKIPGAILHDWKPYGMLSFREVFKKSSNIGVAKISNSLGRSILYHQIKKLGFGAKTGIDLPGEMPGKIKPLSLWSHTSNYIVPIGQEVAVNLLQLASAFASIANGGYLVKPHLVRRISSPFIEKDLPIERRKIFSPSVAERAKNILIETVKDGTGRLAYIEARTIGGKTGTAQHFDIKLGRYSPSDYRASFVGFVETEEAPIVIAVSIFAPKKSHLGGVVAAPLFKKIAREVINYIETGSKLIKG